MKSTCWPAITVLLMAQIVIRCGHNLDKALLTPQAQPGSEAIPTPPPVDNGDDGGSDPVPPPPPGDSGETGGPPVETSTLVSITSAPTGALGAYVPEQVTGLKGKFIALGAGHGWRGRTSSESPGKRLQRPWVWASGGVTYSSAYTSPVNNNAIVEDYLNSEITWYLNQYLRNAGAETTLVRELARQRREVSVCAGAAGYYVQNGGTFYTSANDSAQAAQLCGAGTKYRYVYGDSTGSASFTYSANVPASGLSPSTTTTAMATTAPVRYR
jgi:hypothetical protein